MGMLSLLKRWLPLVIVLVVFTLYLVAIQPHLNSYTSDEIWYVSAARNFINEVGLGRYLVSYGVTVAPSPPCNVTGATPAIYYKDNLMAWYSNVTYTQLKSLMDNSTCIVRFGYYYPDKQSIVTYLNIEHPWFGKCFMVLSMLLLGDKPVTWRVPSMILSALMLILVYYIALYISNNVAYASLASLALLMDASFRDVGIIALLDVYIGFFTLLTVYLYVTKRFTSSSVAAGLAAASKYPGVFTVFAGAYLEAYRRNGLWALVYLAISLIVFIIPQLPIIHLVGGLSNYISDVFFYLKWFTESRPPGPVASNPFDWLIGVDSFVNNVSPPLYAMGLPGAYLVALVYSFLMIIPQSRKLLFSNIQFNEYSIPVTILTMWLGFWMIYLLGNTTLYSYYTMDFAPLIPLELVLAMHRAKPNTKPWIIIAALAGIAYGIAVQWSMIYSLIKAIT
ncbi:phospholipid carrier-dependent glycosyltransferase [Caldivirga maquilingensis]|uniref:Glycosyl transferase family 39 n=1 Tax=Caldivirga maquilingensis (strain ATCC 700844 / DSM 13496 / JCM 10307 / IC-167) TaxID=397948 RepID=A8MDL3_CALMQ|nr:phospholipid carrier-dependent glycosyltransferase [Caldivirga maquilingensis]ABW01869.1 glycosyl transferase family 39 [Caldivirga maquilingensis IC-167]